MIRSRSRLFVAAILLCLATVAAPSLAARDLVQDFRSPPRSAGPWVYWIWVNGNTTKAGIRADLEDMKRVGIRGAMLFEGSLSLPAGPVRYGSNAWHEHVQYAIATAAELGLEIVMMNCAGWATSGGPWNDVDHSMKMVVWSEQAVTGGTTWRGPLPQPPTQLDYYRDVSLLAVPSRFEAPAKLASDDRRQKVAALNDRNAATIVEFTSTTSITFDFGTPTPRRWLEIDLARGAHQESAEGLGHDDDFIPGGKIEVSADGVAFRTVETFADSRLEFSSRVEIGFEPVTARYFRVTFTPAGGIFRAPWRVTELHLSHFRKVAHLAGKTGLKSVPSPSVPAEWSATATGEFSADQIIDLTGRLAADGSLTWDAPPGEWTLLRFGYTTSARQNHPAPPEGQGLEVDKFDAAALAIHFENALGRIIREAGPHAGKALSGVLSDSWEAGPQTWTAALPTEFARRRGYPLHRFLPALTGRMVGNAADTEAFLADYRRTLGELYAQNYYGALQALAHRHGMKLFAEAYGGVLDESRALERVDMPMVEFWNHKLFKGFDFALSAAPLSGNPVVLAEAFTSRPPEWSGWREHPAALKALGDAAYAAGVTGFVLHSYVHQPRTDLAPGFTHGRYGTQIGRLNSWWPLATGWTDYLRRCQLLLQQGRAVADVLQLREERLQTEYRVLPSTGVSGYQAHLLSVAQLDRVSLRDGLLRTSAGATYRVLELPSAWTATTATLQRLLALRDAGAMLAGPRPLAPATLPDTQAGRPAWEAAVAALWSGPTAPAVDATAALTQLGVAPDLHITGDDPAPDVRFTHRTAGTDDFYFVTNQSGRDLVVAADFRSGARLPELWDPLTGRIVPAPVFTHADGRTTLTLSLATAGSVFVAFRRPLPPVWAVAVEHNGARLPIPEVASLPADGTWPAATAGAFRLRFSDGRTSDLAPAAPALIELPAPWRISFAGPARNPAAIEALALGSLSADPRPDVRHFSGIATYETRFTLPADATAADRQVLLDLGVVHDIAEISVNGRMVATVWQPPCLADITAFVRAGENVLTVRVGNRWINRLVGDEALPPDARYTVAGSAAGALEILPAWWEDPQAAVSRERSTFSTWKYYTAASPLVPSGLAGPVRLHVRPRLDWRPEHHPAPSGAPDAVTVVPAAARRFTH
ncbi:MAG: glycosyl hydrolase [Lacunisphaera sp.]|nr:glycosyl hydrolase [Lacunisphaera sp.]